MKLSKNEKSHNNFLLSFLKKTFNIIVSIIKELFKTLSYFALGLFKVFDFILSKTLILISYIYCGLVNMFKYIGKFSYILGKFMYNYFLKFLFIELYALLKSIVVGLYRFSKLLFYEIPLFIFKSFSDFFDLIRKRTKILQEKMMYFFKHTPNAIGEYFKNKWNNLSLVKYYKNKRERELEVLLIDKFGKDAERSEKKHVYEYLARNAEGKLIKGYFSALSRLDVHSYLIDNGFEVYEIKTNKWLDFTRGETSLFNVKMKNKDLVYWLAQLSTYLKAGIPLADAVKILAEQDKRSKYRKIYASLIYELTTGETFSESLRKQNNAFPALLINMVKAAELIGDLESTLDEMSKYYEEKEATKKQLVGAITYPSIILVFANIVIIFLIVYIIPQFKSIYEGLGAELTGITLILLNVSDFLKNNYVSIIMGLISFIMFFIVFYRKLKAFRTFVQYILMHLPVVGKLIIYNEMNLFAKTFAVLNKNNVLLTDSIDILGKITNNEFYKMIMFDTISNLLRGEKISLSFKDNWAVPTLAYYMISTGEQTGELSNMLTKVSEYYEREQRALSNTLKTVLEPILMVFLALIVGVIMISVLVPMYSIGQEIL